jgi:hypothetical protein
VNLLSLLFGGARGTPLDERRGDEEETGRTEAGFRFLKTKKRSLSIDATLFCSRFFLLSFALGPQMPFDAKVTQRAWIEPVASVVTEGGGEKNRVVN